MVGVRVLADPAPGSPIISEMDRDVDPPRPRAEHLPENIAGMTAAPIVAATSTTRPATGEVTGTSLERREGGARALATAVSLSWSFTALIISGPASWRHGLSLA